MIAAIEGAERQILFETYIWKGDEIGQRFKDALAAAADRGVEVYCIYDAFANLVVSPAFKRFPDTIKVLKYPVYAAGWRFFDLRRYGRDHRKILVVDDAVGFVGGYNIGTAFATEWRDTHVGITGPGRVGPEAGVRRLLEPQPAQALRAQRATPAAGDGVDVGAADALPPQRAAADGLPDPGDVPRGDGPGQQEHLDDLRLLHPRPGLRRHDAARRRARGRRPGAGAAEVQPRGGRLDLTRLLRPAAPRGRAGDALPRRDGARQDLHHRRFVVHGRDGQRRPALPAAATTRSTSR